MKPAIAHHDDGDLCKHTWTVRHSKPQKCPDCNRKVYNWKLIDGVWHCYTMRKRRMTK